MKGDVDIDKENEKENEEENKNNDEFTYDYLLRMQIRTLTLKIMQKMKEEYELKLAEYKVLESKTEKDLWKEDLDKFIKVYNKMLKEYLERQNDIKFNQNNSNKKKIKVV